MDNAEQASISALARVRDNVRAERSGQSSGRQQCDWPEPKPLPNGLAPVEPSALSSCLTRWRRGSMTSPIDCSARLITLQSLHLLPSAP
jgi:hypothetical protein